MANARFSFVLSILFASTCISLATDVSPVLWLNSPDRKFSAVTTVREGDFQSDVKKECSPGPCVIFAGDRLTLRDLNLNENSFEHIRAMPAVSLVPNVENSYKAFRDLASSEVYLTPEGELSQELTPQSQIVVVTLPVRRDDQTWEAYFAECDRGMDNVMKKHGIDNIRYAFVGRTSGLVHSRKIRAAEPAEGEAQTEQRQSSGPKDTPSFFLNNNLLIYFTSLTAKVGQQTDLITVTSLAVSDVTANTLAAELKSEKVSIKLNLEERSGFWFVANGQVNNNPILGDNTIGASRTFSYHCSPAITFRVKNGTATDPSSITIRGLQIEPKFGDANNPIKSFSPAQDCVGFTSAGIWAGLFVVIMLLVILSIGITWIMDIRTMDRFDDPKGKTITISASD